MKTTILLAALTVLASGCGAPNAASFQLLNAPVLNTTNGACTPDSALVRSRGSVDISGSSSYLLPFYYKYLFGHFEYASSDKTIIDDGSANNTLFVNEARISYQSEPDIGLTADVNPMHYVIQPGAEGDSAYVIVNALTSDAATTLSSMVVPGSSVDLLVSIQLAGTTAGGTNITSNTVKYPITVFSSGFTGCSGSTRSLNGTCGNPGGQDGSKVGCCNTPGFAGVGGCP